MSDDNFQARSTKDGLRFKKEATNALIALGYQILDSEIEGCDLVVRYNGHIFAVLAHGSYEGSRPGLKRTDTLKKAIADANTLRAYYPDLNILLVTSDMIDATGSGWRMLRAAFRRGLVNGVYEVQDDRAAKLYVPDYPRLPQAEYHNERVDAWLE